MTELELVESPSRVNERTAGLHALGQRVWLDNITRAMLNDGTLAHYIETLSVTGLTSNPTIFARALAEGDAYAEVIGQAARNGRSSEALFFDLAVDDIRNAADLFRDTFDRSSGMDGWVSLEVSPLLARNSAQTIRSARELHARVDRPNLLVKIPGTREGLVAVEQCIFERIPVNVTLLFSSAQCMAANAAYMRGIARRVASRLPANVASVASLFVSRWDVAVNNSVAPDLRNRLGIAMAMRAYREQGEMLASPHWRALEGAGARPQRLLWASTGTKDPDASDTLYVSALVAADTIDTIPEQTLLEYGYHGVAGAPLQRDGGDAEAIITAFHQAGIDDVALAEQLQQAGVIAFEKAWEQLLETIRTRRHA